MNLTELIQKSPSRGSVFTRLVDTNGCSRSFSGNDPFEKLPNHNFRVYYTIFCLRSANLTTAQIVQMEGVGR